MITLFWCPRTRASRILWLLEELGEPFDVRLIDIRKPEARQDPEFVASSPMGKVPAIMDDTGGAVVRVADSAAIALYLADRYPAAGLAPAPDDPLRGPFLFWTTFTPGVLEPALAEKFNNWEVSRATSGWGDWNLMVEVLERGLERGPWILGDRFSAADIMLGSSVYFMKIFGVLPDSQVLSDYGDRCLARPAYGKALARDAELED
ncbi:MAG: glutathione S-transferase family protein [Lysobacterales bacterium]|jgi:glutathione S-transferase